MATTASWLSNRYEVSESTASGQDVLKRAKESRPLLAVDVSCSAAERAVYEARLTLLYRLLTTPSPITVSGRARRPQDSRAPLPLRRQRSSVSAPWWRPGSREPRLAGRCREIGRASCRDSRCQYV